MPENVAIAGGGASGVILAAHLLRVSTTAQVSLYEPNTPGYGVAYATTCPLHLLNVPASNMSAFPAEPAHFTAWLGEHYPGIYEARAFVPRRVYGEYLRTTFESMVSDYGYRFEHIRRSAHLADIEDASISVLATGNGAPAHWRGAPDSPRFYGNAWVRDALVPGDPDEAVLILGSGLTAVDAVLGLLANGHRGPAYFVSRRGLMPHEHRTFDVPHDDAPEATSMHELVDAFRSGTGDWRGAIDRARSQTNAFWQALALADQQRFLRHAAPYWSVHRHRMAPESAKVIAERIAAGSLQVIAARTTGFSETPTGLQVRIRERGHDTERTLTVARAINCSGPEHDVTKLTNPLLAELLERGRIRPHPLKVGLDVGPDGSASKRLFTIGPLRYGTLIETTAIPEIRVQADELARNIAALLAVSEA